MKKDKATLITNLYDPPNIVALSTAPPKGVWSTEAKMVSKCEIYESTPTNVAISPAVYIKISKLMAKYPNHEWLAYLVGKKHSDNNFLVTDLLIPKQEQSTATVDLDPAEQIDLSQVIGTIHSHHSMGAFFSGTDEKFIVPNHPVAIITSNHGWTCKVRTPLPCGHFTAGFATLDIKESITINDLNGFLKTADEKITVKTYVAPATTSINKWKREGDVTTYQCQLCAAYYPISDVHWQYGSWLCSECDKYLKQLPERVKDDFVREISAGATIEGATDKLLKDKGDQKEGFVKVACSVCGKTIPLKESLLLNGIDICADCFETHAGCDY